MVNIRKKSISLLLIFFLLVSIVGAINVDTSYAATKKIHLKKTTVSIIEGKTYQQKLIDKKGKTIKATKVKWKSSKTSVAKINKKGKITAVKAGTAKMTAKYKGKTYKFTVKVRKPNLKAVKFNLSHLFDDEIVLALETSNDASKFQIYVSRNDGAFQYYETQKLDEDGMLRYNSGEDKLTGKYSFKIRGVYGKYKGTFSAVKSLSFGPYIEIENTSYDVTVGETVVVKVLTNDGATTGYTITNSSCIEILSRETGTNEKGQYYECVTIKGKKAGTAILEFYVGDTDYTTKDVNILVSGGPQPIFDTTFAQGTVDDSEITAHVNTCDVVYENNTVTLKVDGYISRISGTGTLNRTLTLYYLISDENGTIEKGTIPTNCKRVGDQFNVTKTIRSLYLEGGKKYIIAISRTIWVNN